VNEDGTEKDKINDLLYQIMGWMASINRFTIKIASQPGKKIDKGGKDHVIGPF